MKQQVRSPAGGRGRGGQEELGRSWRSEGELSGRRGPLSSFGRRANTGVGIGGWRGAGWQGVGWRGGVCDLTLQRHLVGTAPAAPQVRCPRWAGWKERGKDADASAAEVLNGGVGRDPGQPALLGEQPGDGREGDNWKNRARGQRVGMMECGVSARAAR